MRNQNRNYLFSAVILSETKDLNAKAVYEEILRFTQDDSPPLEKAEMNAAIKAELAAVNFAAAPNLGRGIIFVAKITVPSVLGCCKIYTALNRTPALKGFCLLFDLKK